MSDLAPPLPNHAVLVSPITVGLNLSPTDEKPEEMPMCTGGGFRGRYGGVGETLMFLLRHKIIS